MTFKKIMLVLTLLGSSNYCHGEFFDWIDRLITLHESDAVANHIDAETRKSNATTQLINIEAESKQADLAVQKTRNEALNELIKTQMTAQKRENMQKELDDPFLTFLRHYLSPEFFERAEAMSAYEYEKFAKAYWSKIEKELANNDLQRALRKKLTKAQLNECYLTIAPTVSAKLEKLMDSLWLSRFYDKILSAGCAGISLFCLTLATLYAKQSAIGELGILATCSIVGAYFSFALASVAKNYHGKKYKITKDIVVPTFEQLQTALNTLEGATVL